MKKAWRMLLIGALLGVVSGAATAKPLPKTGGPWALEPNDFVHYQLDVDLYADGDNTSTDPRDPMHGAFGFYGYELAKGERPMRTLTQEEWLLLPYAFWMPARLKAKARSVTIKDDFTQFGRLESKVKGRGKLVVTDVRKTDDTHEVDLAGNVVFKVIPTEDEWTQGMDLSPGTGTLTWSSTFDLDAGLMRRVEFKLSVDRASMRVRPNGTEANPRANRMRFEGTLVLHKHLRYRYAGFKQDVARAIERGMAALEKRRQRDDGWHQRSHYPVGEPALAALTLVKGGWDRQAKNLRDVIQWLTEQEPDHTYSVGVALAALEAWGAPDRELGEGEQAADGDHATRVLSDREREWVNKAAKWLIDTAKMGDTPAEADRAGSGRRSKRKKPKAVTGTSGWIRWWYPKHRGLEMRGGDARDRWDNSNTQYAVLGLHSASLCKAPIPKHVWFRILGHYLLHQRKSGPPMKGFEIRGPDKGPYAGERKGGRRRYAESPQARGWGYGHLAGDEARSRSSAYGSMTCAGIASLAIADGALTRLKIGRYSAEERRRVQAAIRDGFAFLAKHWAVWENPNQGGYYTFYYLYGLERAAMLAGVKWIGSHDWYWEGAVQLLMCQEPSGMWCRDIIETSFAVLFLKRGTRAVITPR